MAHDADISIDDAEALKVRRKDLYAFMEEIAAAAAMLPQPETYLEAERAVRAITIADRFVQRFDLAKANETPAAPPSPTPPLPVGIRRGLRMLADRMMAAAKTIPLPDNAITALRALRYAQACDRMLTQLYTSPKPKPARPEQPARPAIHSAPPRLTFADCMPQIRKEMWEQFSSSPEAKAIREAKRLAAQSAYEAERPATLESDNTTSSPTKETKAQTAETHRLNPRPDISEGQADKGSDQTPDPP